MKTTVLQQLAQLFAAYKRTGRPDLKQEITSIMRDHMPNGNGIDTEIQFDWEQSKPERLVLLVSFHHMDDNGLYKGCTRHQAIIRPSLVTGYTLRITGKNYRGIKWELDEWITDSLDAIIPDPFQYKAE